MIERLRPVWVAITIVLLGLAVVELVMLHGIIDAQDAVGTDLDYYRFVADRWLTTGVYYTDEQLAGPYQVQTLIHNLYPPHALFLFIPFLVLPAILWWGLPLAFIGYVVAWCRPAPWAWPILAGILAFPKTPAQIVFGNTDMWLAAFIAAGVRWAWPAVLVTIKPSLAFFAVIGIGTRRWWIAAAVLAIASAPFIGLWLDYPAVTLNSSARFYYSFGNLPFFVLPIVAWLASSRREDRSIQSWAAQLIRRTP